MLPRWRPLNPPIDGSYHYFNTDGSYYYSDGKPGKAKAKGESIYVSPRSERFYTPPDTFLGQGEYFIGRHWQTGIENIYWEHGDGSIERTFRKNVDVENQKLNWEYIAEKNYRPIVVDQYGNPSGRSQHSFMPQGREQVGMEVTAGWQMQSQSTAVAEIPPTPRSVPSVIELTHLGIKNTSINLKTFVLTSL
jgi:hypothetical protein